MAETETNKSRPRRYRIIRLYLYQPGKARIIRRGLTLAQARAHFVSPETSSATCKRRRAIEHTRMFGPWLDWYEVER